ncbi:MAG: sialate O-acetylesterase [Bacteroidota bacterium]
MNYSFRTTLLIIIFSTVTYLSGAQVFNATRSGTTWINRENVTDKDYGAGYTVYSAAWPIFKEYPGPHNFQMGLAGCWLSTLRTGTEPDQFYTTIEGGLGWWHDTRFGTKIPKFIMGGVSHNFFAWANGPGAGRSYNLSNGQRDWSTSGGKYGVAQLSNRLLWAPDGLNLAQSLNGEMLGYGYTPLPLTKPMQETNGVDIETGNQCWTLFLNSTNFKGPATFFLPTFWTRPVLYNPSLEGLFLDSRPSEPNIGFGIEHLRSPALMANDGNGNTYAKMERLHFPVSNEDNSILLSKISVYSQNALWNNMESWFNGGPVVSPGMMQSGIYDVSFENNGGFMVGHISSGGVGHAIELDYMDNIQLSSNIMGYEFDLNTVTEKNDRFLMPEYFKLESNDKWHAIDENEVPAAANLVDAVVPRTPRSEITYLTPLEPDCQWQDPDGPWNNPGPAAGPFKAEMGDGSTLTYYWYRFVDQPAVIHANLPNDIRDALQTRVELIHANWSHTDEYFEPPAVGQIATLDPAGIVQPPAGLEIGYVPIVTRQEKSDQKVRVFVLAGQSNMQGYGTINGFQNTPGTLEDVIQNDAEGNWSAVGEPGNWNTLDDVSLYFENNGNTIRSNVTVGQGANSNLIGPELMFAHQLDAYYDDPVLIIKTAWGGKSLAVDFRPPSAGGTTGEFYNKMIQIVQDVTQNLNTEFPNIGATDFEISGFAWFQGWNDGANDSYLQEYESNLYHLVDDVRNDLGVADLPVVIANSGHGGFLQNNGSWVQNMQTIVSVAQENVGCNDTLYGGRVGFVETKQHYLDGSASPINNGIHHFHNNALTFLNIGKDLGDEMILAINDMAFCYTDCEQQVSPAFVSIGNRVWHDYNQNGINDPDEPGIPGVSLVLWSDPDGDGIPDWQGFEGVQITDDEGYYQFSDLTPGNYVVFVWQVNNWGSGEPLEGFQSTNGFVADANNDVDFDNNGFGAPFSDIQSGIVTLTVDGEPLNDGDPYNCYINYDAGGNNTVDFGFFNPCISVTDEEMAICSGETYWFNGTPLEQTGAYEAILTASNGCDSIVRLSLEVLPSVTNQLNAAVCQGDTYSFEGTELDEPGQYQATYTAANGCDSTVTLDLVVLNHSVFDLSANICEGTTYPFNGQDLDESGIYTATYTNAEGCDSTVTLQLEVLDMQETQLSASICDGDSYQFNNEMLTAAGQYEATYTATNGCDSLAVLTLEVLQPTLDNVSASICAGETYDFHGQIIDQTGIYETVLTAANGCDSTILLNLTFLPQITESLNVDICSGSSFFFNGEELDQQGEYEASLTASNGCDSIVVLTLTVTDLPFNEMSASICEGDIYDFYGTSLTQSGTYTDTLSGSSSCDTLVTLHLSVLLNETIQAEAAICEGETYPFNGQELAQPGIYEAVFSAMNGCDSIVILTLSLLPNVITNVELALIEGELYNGIPILSDTTFTEIYTANNGCDSTVFVSIDVMTSTNELDALLYQLGVSPNPFADQFQIDLQLGTSALLSLVVLDVSGREMTVVLDRQLKGVGQHGFTVNTAKWPAGVYFLRLQTDEGQRMVKVVKG